MTGLALVFVTLCLFSKAQTISNEQLFGVEGYSVFERGYPLKVEGGPGGKFFYLEYWPAGKQGRTYTNFYLQCYGTRDYIEHWYKPITEEGAAVMQPSDLIKTAQRIAVIGHQFREEVKETHTVARFYDFDGKANSVEPVQLSNYKKLGKNFSEKIVLSNQKKRLLWMGVGEEGLYYSVWDEYGKQVWEKQLNLPYVKDKYLLREVTVDEHGDLYMLVLPVTPSTSIREKSPLLLLRYRYEKDAFETYTWELKDQAVPIMMHLEVEGKEAYLAGVVSTPDAPGFLNSQSQGKKDLPRPMTHLVFRRFSEQEDGLLKAVSSQIHPVPVTWASRYQAGGHFSRSKVVVSKDDVILILEEYFSEKDKLYFYDLGCVSFVKETGNIRWNQIIGKRQRDKQSEAFMSYIPGISRGKLRLVYLTERGASGKVYCTSIDLDDGKLREKILTSNESDLYLFFPSRSCMVSDFEMVLLGIGNPNQNDFKLFTVTF